MQSGGGQFLSGGQIASGGVPFSGGGITFSGGVTLSGGSTGSGGVVATGGATGGSGYCEVQAMMNKHCTRCHADSPIFGAPMSLTSYADLTAASPNGGIVYDRALALIKSGTMPPAGPTTVAVTPAEIASLESWIASGATQTATCGATGIGGMDAGSGGTTGGNDGTCIDCGNYTCNGTPVQFRAHGQPTPGDTSPYDASGIGGPQTLGDPNLYQCFYFKAPWVQGQQSIGFKPLIDNSRVLHHWLLYASENAPPELSDGGLRGDCQLQEDQNRVLLAGWAPGTPGQNLPDDVGQELPLGPNSYVTLEVHYYNTKPGEPADDHSGVELCLVDEPRPHEATQHWLGTEKINIPAGSQGTATDTCTPTLSPGQTSTILAFTPHMHLTGKHAKVELYRAGNPTPEVLHDGAFDFDNQTTYYLDEPVVVNAGDYLKTTCTYQNPTSAPIAFGEGSDEEMCYIYTTAYPAGSLHPTGKNGCAGPLCVPGGVRRCIDNENILDAVGGL